MKPIPKTHRDHRPGMPEVALRFPSPHGIVCTTMTALRELRRAADISQQEFAALIGVPNTFRMWDSGLTSQFHAQVLHRAPIAVAQHRRLCELLTLEDLAKELSIHIRTLQAAARTGRLEVEFSVRSVLQGARCGALLAPRQKRFLSKHYRCFSGQADLPACPSHWCRATMTSICESCGDSCV